MSSQIQSQAAKLWNLLFAPSTGETYKKAIDLTWAIATEALRLVWLVFCLVLVVGDWAWRNSVGAGRSLRGWVNDLEQPTADRLLKEAGNSLLSASKNSAAFAVSTAKDQLGIVDPPKPVEETPAAIAAAPVTAAAPAMAAPTTSATSATPASSSATPSTEKES